MPRLPRLPDVERDDADDVEVGALVWSRSISAGAFPLGGCVLKVDGEFVTVLTWNGRVPIARHLEISDIDPGTMSFHTKSCFNDAHRLLGWLVTLGDRELKQNASWVQHLATLMELVVAPGSYTPRAERRFQAAHPKGGVTPSA